MRRRLKRSPRLSPPFPGDGRRCARDPTVGITVPVHHPDSFPRCGRGGLARDPHRDRRRGAPGHRWSRVDAGRRGARGAGRGRRAQLRSGRVAGGMDRCLRLVPRLVEESHPRVGRSTTGSRLCSGSTFSRSSGSRHSSSARSPSCSDGFSGSVEPGYRTRPSAEGSGATVAASTSGHRGRRRDARRRRPAAERRGGMGTAGSSDDGERTVAHGWLPRRRSVRACERARPRRTFRGDEPPHLPPRVPCSRDPNRRVWAESWPVPTPYPRPVRRTRGCLRRGPIRDDPESIRS
jgi:hypothetical protein